MSPRSNVPSKVLVIGHSGFVGRSLCECFQRRNPEVVVTGLSVETVDLTDKTAFAVLVDALQAIDTIVVLAGIKKQLGDTASIFRQNMAIATNICEALSRCPLRRVIFFSSAEVYGEHVNDTDMSEVTPVRPTSYYGIAKFASEGLFRKAAETTGASLMILRPPLVYGRGDPQVSYGPSAFVRAAVRGEKITLWGDGAEYREFLYLNDLVEVTRQLLFSRAHGVLNVSSSAHASFRSVIEIVQQLLGQPLLVESRPRTRPSVNQGYRNDRLRRLLPDFEFTPLQTALRSMLTAEGSAAIVSSK